MREVAQNPASRVALIDPNQGPGPSRAWFRFFEQLYAFTVTAFAQIIKTTTTSAAAATPTAVTFDAISSDRRISVNSSQVFIQNDGLYNIQISGQLVNSGAADNVVIWLKANGTDIPDSARHFTVPASGNSVLSYNQLFDFGAGQYFQVYYYTTSGDTELTTISSGAYPQSPAMILTVTQVL